MVRTPQEFAYKYEDLERLTGFTTNALYQYTKRGQLDPTDFEDVILFVCRHGTLGFRRRMFERMVSQDDPASVRIKARERRAAKKKEAAEKKTPRKKSS